MSETTTGDKEEKQYWKHKIISGPILSGSEKLQKRLNELGNSGWKLVDTQRHSIAGKQEAVCFLRKRVNSEFKLKEEIQEDLQPPPPKSKPQKVRERERKELGPPPQSQNG